MIEELYQHNQIIKLVATDPQDGAPYKKVVLRPVMLKEERHFQAEMFTDKQVFHKNLAANQLAQWFDAEVDGKYRQILVNMTDKSVTYLRSSKGKVKRLQQSAARSSIAERHNRPKNYILNEGDNIPALVDLGIFTAEGKVVSGMYDKFRQINRFAEILDDVFKHHSGALTLLDFGCGKSYLTFIVYHYLTNVRHIDARIIGYDLKADVVDNCNRLAAKYGYGGLRFEVADVSKDKLYDRHIDAVISLHACDTATDHALHFAIAHNVPYIFPSPAANTR